MSDKTCGTCVRLDIRSNPPFPLYGRFPCWYSTSIASNGIEIPNVRKPSDDACDSWIERTDSVEQIARYWRAWCLRFDLDPEPFIDRLADLGYKIFE